MRLAVLAFEGISPFMLSTPLAVFGEPFLTGGNRVEVCAATPRFSAGILTVEAPSPLRAATEADVVILPGWRDAREPVTVDLVDTLRTAHRRGAVVVGLCLGAFGVAEAGLLDGRRATTHWAHADTFAARFPRVAVDSDALFVDQGAVLTSAGIASGLDCCLHLLARLSGAGEANRVARHLVVAPLRAGPQPQVIARPSPGTSADRRVSALLEALWADPCAPAPLDELAAGVGLSRRSLTRHIRARTGGSLGDWLRRARLARAQDLLADGARGLDDIAPRSGFPDAHALRAAFRVELGLTPTQWQARQRAGGAARRLR